MLITERETIRLTDNLIVNYQLEYDEDYIELSIESGGQRGRTKSIGIKLSNNDLDYNKCKNLAHNFLDNLKELNEAYYDDFNGITLDNF